MHAAARRTLAPFSRGNLRRVALGIFTSLIACGQITCALELLGLRLPSPSTLLAIECVVVLASVLFALRGAEESKEMAGWAAIGLGVWTIWGALYFGAAAITDPPHARTFDDAVLQKLPILPSFAALYLGVHVFSVVPYCAIREARLLRRYMLGNLLIVLFAAIAWVALPVRLDRPPFGDDVPGFGAWLLRGVYRLDPTTNCFPSAHCAVAVYAALGLRDASRRLFVWGVATATGICLSTVMTRQHYVADVFAGAALAAVASYAMRRGRGRLSIGPGSPAS